MSINKCMRTPLPSVYSITHFRTASLTSRAISALACFLALSVIPTNVSSARGEVASGSNSRR